MAGLDGYRTLLKLAQDTEPDIAAMNQNLILTGSSAIQA